MELQAQLTALEQEVEMLKGEIKAILQEVRIAVLARENPFLADDFERSGPAARGAGSFDMSEGSYPAAAIPPAATAPTPITPITIVHETAPAPEPSRPVPSPVTESPMSGHGEQTSKTSKRPVDLAALMVWVQESAEAFNHSEFVMLVTMASYAEFFDEGLKQALIDMSQQISREHSEKASLADFSVALKQLESIRAFSNHQRQIA